MGVEVVVGEEVIEEAWAERFASPGLVFPGNMTIRVETGVAPDKTMRVD
jgi:hypothetical protein